MAKTRPEEQNARRKRGLFFHCFLSFLALSRIYSRIYKKKASPIPASSSFLADGTRVFRLNAFRLNVYETRRHASFFLFPVVKCGCYHGGPRCCCRLCNSYARWQHSESLQRCWSRIRSAFGPDVSDIEQKESSDWSVYLLHSGDVWWAWWSCVASRAGGWPLPAISR